MKKGFPEASGPVREKMILAIVSNEPERLDYSWHTITCHNGKNQGSFQVMRDAMKIDGVRISVSATLQQKIADKLGCTFLTPKLCDLIWHHADVKIGPVPVPLSATSEMMLEHSYIIDARIRNKEPHNKLIATTGKNWVISNALSKPSFKNQAMSYGWHFCGGDFNGRSGFPNVSGLKDPLNRKEWKVLQELTALYDKDHVDASYTCRLVRNKCTINGKLMDIQEVLKDKDLCHLISHEGPVHCFRQPGVSRPDMNFFTPSFVDEIVEKNKKGR